VNRQTDVGPPFLTRAVTRLTVTLSGVGFNTSAEREHSMRTKTKLVLLAALVGLGTLAVAAAQAGPYFSAWNLSQKIDDIAGNHPDLNTASLDGCPIQSPDGLSLYMASNRPGGKGALDIWVATRTSENDPWGAPVNLPEPINSASDDFCPTPINGKGLLFVSRRVVQGVTCGLGDIYVTRRNPAKGWSEPEHLDCDPAGPNSVLDEQGPSYVQGRLYFSRSTLPPGNSGELHASDKHGDMGFGPASPIVELNDAGANDIQPNVRKDGREIVFSSNRAGGAGGPDIWSATRVNVDVPWSAPVNLGPNVNTGAGESRPSLSWDAQQLLFGRAGAAGTGEGGTGMSDIYVTTRDKSND
jgi:WD40-like Beta Propeller Repeat